MKAFATVASVVAVVAIAAAVYLFRQSYERARWFEPTTLIRQTGVRPDLEGIWTGIFYYPQDCGLNGCETRERVQLNIRTDSTARLVFAIDTLEIIYVPFTDLVYARPGLWRVKADEAIIQSDRLVMAWDTSISVPFEVRGDSLLFDGLDSAVSSL